MQLFALLLVLTLLPLNSLQSMLLFNANFWRVIQKNMRTNNFLERLWY